VQDTARFRRRTTYSGYLDCNKQLRR